MVLELVRRERSKNDNKISGLEKCAWRFSSLRLRMQGRYCGGEKGKCDMDSVAFEVPVGPQHRDA
jgi:hypothetical protein